MTIASMIAPRDLRVSWGFIAGVWAVLTALTAMQFLLNWVVGGSFTDAIGVMLQPPTWLLWAPATPVVVWAVQRFPYPSDGAKWPTVVRHFAIGIGISVAVEAVSVLLAALVAGPVVRLFSEPELRLRMVTTIFGRGLFGLFMYATIAGVAWATLADRRARDRERLRAQLALDLAEAQVRAIKMQVHPHFLFNALHAIGVLIEDEPRVAAKMVMQLGQLLRRTLERAGTLEVTLRDELELLDLYFQIERIRFRDRLRVTYDIADASLDALIPDLILQPLAENAVKHGIGRNPDGGEVVIGARVSDGRLVVEVRDPGVGVEHDQSTLGLGLSTVRERLSHLYGEEAHFELAPAQPSGTIARLVLPYRTEARTV